jgi:hypothetical protein
VLHVAFPRILLSSDVVDIKVGALPYNPRGEISNFGCLSVMYISCFIESGNL